MDALDIPLLQESDLLEDAISQMRVGDRRAIAVQRRDGFEFLLNSEIADAAAIGLTTLEKVPTREERLVPKDVGTPQMREAVRRALATAYGPGMLVRHGSIPGVDHKDALQLLDASDFAVLVMDGDWVRVLTRHEGFAARLDPQPIWACSKNRGHRPPTPPVQAGAACDFCDGVYQAI